MDYSYFIRIIATIINAKCERDTALFPRITIQKTNSPWKKPITIWYLTEKAY